MTIYSLLSAKNVLLASREELCCEDNVAGSTRSLYTSFETETKIRNDTNTVFSTKLQKVEDKEIPNYSNYLQQQILWETAGDVLSESLESAE